MSVVKVQDRIRHLHSGFGAPSKTTNAYAQGYDLEVEGEGGQHTVPRQVDTTPPQTEEILSALKELARARDEKLGTYLEPLVDCGAAANEDRARLARCKRGAPLTFGGC